VVPGGAEEHSNRSDVLYVRGHGHGTREITAVIDAEVWGIPTGAMMLAP
jgi:hypothetical protein